MSKNVSQSGQLSRVDLLQALVAEDNGLTECVATQLGLMYVPEERDFMTAQITGFIHAEANNSAVVSSAESANLRPVGDLWLLESREYHEPKDEGEKTTPLPIEIEWRSRPAQPPQYRLLASPQHFIPRLLPYLHHQFSGLKPDVKQLVSRISQGHALDFIPKLARQNSGNSVQIIDDRHTHLIPYWKDHAVLRHVIRSLVNGGVETAVLMEGQRKPRLLDGSGDGQQTWKPPGQRGVVVIFSDLGALSLNAEAQISCWLALGMKLKQAGCQPVVFLPCSAALCDVRLKAFFTLESLVTDDIDLRRVGGARDEQQQVDLLLNALSPVIRLEPGLLRQMRLEMGKHGEQWRMSTAIEAMLWQHVDIQEPHSVAASWNREARKQRLQQFEQLSPEERQTALQVIRQWRQPLAKQIWFEELASLNSESRRLMAEDAQAAIAYFKQSCDEKTLETGSDKADWLQRACLRIPDEVFEDDELGEALQRIKFQVMPESVGNVDPRKLPPSRGEEKQAVLYQQGEQLKLELFDPQREKAMGYSPLGQLRLKHDLVRVEADGKRLGELRLSAAESLTLPKAKENITIASDVESLLLQQTGKPEWAENWGRDRYGIFGDLLIEGIYQRFRWIEPGRFMMGSPEDEAERWGDEDLHQVTLSYGFWLADTAVTQQLWQLVMGSNPAKFKDDPLNPVEWVSWEGSSVFLERLSAKLEKTTVRLPRETEWEYACRAGTQTPFYLGENIHTYQVNFNGEHPYNGAKEERYRKKTVPVKTFPPNPWGLYEMHGNVDEWCGDVWQENLGHSPVKLSHPEQSGQQESSGSARRVVRGGAWNSYGRSVRSAFRDGNAPAYRHDDLGLRLALGH